MSMEGVISPENYVRGVAPHQLDPLLARLQLAHNPPALPLSTPERLRQLARLVLAVKTELAIIETKLAREAAIPPPVALHAILSAVSKYYAISKNDILSDRRTGAVARSRMITYWLCRQLSRASYPRIAKFMGGRDHTTIMSGIRKIESRRADNPDLDSELNYFIATLSQKEAA